MEEKLEYTKMRERLEWAIKEVKKLAEEQKLEFDKDIFIEAIEVGKCMFVRSEIAYSGKK